MQKESNQFYPQFSILLKSKRVKFRDWDSEKRNIPKSIAGVYVVWHEKRFVWAGMAGCPTRGRLYKDAGDSKEKGLRRRLGKHARGNRGGDQFCVRVCDCFIYPRLSQKDRQLLAKGTNILDGKNGKIREFIKSHLEFQFLQTKDCNAARQLETALRSGKCSRLRRPFMNPK